MKLNKEIKNFIYENYLGISTFELTDLVNEKFKSNYSRSTIVNFKKSNKLRSGIDTTFKKGQIPHNLKAKGYEFINSEGYTMIKNDQGKWELKHRHIYKKKYGSIPDNCSVIFGDMNKNNFDIDNLILVRIKDKLVAKNKHLLFGNINLTKTGILIAKLINKVEEKRGVKNDRNTNSI